jgi:hypothetical protein
MVKGVLIYVKKQVKGKESRTDEGDFAEQENAHFVIARTARKVSRNSKTRSWRSEKMKVKVK